MTIAFSEFLNGFADGQSGHMPSAMPPAYRPFKRISSSSSCSTTSGGGGPAPFPEAGDMLRAGPASSGTVLQAPETPFSGGAFSPETESSGGSTPRSQDPVLRTQAADFDGDEHHAPSMTGQDSASFSVGTPPMSNDGGGGSDRLLLPSPAKPPSCPEDKDMSLHDCRDDSDIPTSPTWSSTNPGGGSDDHASTGESAGEGHFFFPVSRSTADPAGATTSALMFPDAMSPVGDPSPSSDDHGRHQQSQNVDDDSGDNEDRSSSDAGDASPSLQSTTSAGAPISECDDSSQVNNSEHSSDGNGSHYPASDIALSNTAAIGRLRGNSKSKLCDMNGVAPTITAGTSTTTTTITPKGIVSTTPRGRGRPRMLPQIGTPPAIPEEQSQTRWLTTITPNSTTSASAAAASVA
ncbi:unnamed protein product, partial [Sphacelaria rigidula]